MATWMVQVVSSLEVVFPDALGFVWLESQSASVSWGSQFASVFWEAHTWMVVGILGLELSTVWKKAASRIGVTGLSEKTDCRERTVMGHLEVTPTGMKGC